jgi:GNAT superfamily N-acetyltransferase
VPESDTGWERWRATKQWRLGIGMGQASGMAAPTTELMDLAVDDPRMPEALGVLAQLRPKLTLEQWRQIYAEGHPQGLRFTVVQEGGAIVAVAGWRLVACTTAGRRLYIDDLVTDSSARSSGHGKLLLTELEQRARDAGCTVLDLDSGVQRGAAHRFYFREGMTITAYHFTAVL